jgi:DNA-binding CsgD family transcriptional regulator
MLSRHKNAFRLASLTETEIEILRLLARGIGNKEIAQNMQHSHNTTRAHLRSIFRKLKATNRRDAAIAGGFSYNRAM